MTVPDSAPNPANTLAILLGATEWPEFPALKDPIGRKTSTADQFAASAEAFLEYLLAPAGLGLPPGNVKNLFDDPRSPSDLMVEVARFLRDRKRRVGVVRDVMVYFLGHGVPPEDQHYFLVPRYTKEGYKLTTGLSASILVEVLVEQARHARCHLILDVCFAGAAAGVFYSNPRPHQKVGLLCAANSRSEAKAPDEQERTMYTGALLDVLWGGSEIHGEWLTPGQVHELVVARLEKSHPSSTPEIHNPGQLGGLVTNAPLFPNRCLKAKQGETGSVGSPRNPLPALPAGPLELVILARESLARVEEAAIESIRLEDEVRTREMQHLVRLAIQMTPTQIVEGRKGDDMIDFIKAWSQFEQMVSERYAELRYHVARLDEQITRFCDRQARPARQSGGRKRKERP